MTAELAIEMDSCSYTYDGRVCALRAVSCTIQVGGWVALIGQNGSGKSTLARVCNGLLRPQSGQVRILGRDTRGRSVSDLARDVGYLFQNPDHEIFAPTVREEVGFGLRNLGFAADEIERRIDEALARFDLTAHADRPPAILGHGLRRQVTLASLFARRPSILILDEPTSGLDWDKVCRLLDHLAQLRDVGHTVLFITHNLRLVAERAMDVLVLHQGAVLAQGPAREILVQQDVLGRASMTPPPITRLSQALQPRGMRGDSLTVEGFYGEYMRVLSERTGLRR